MSLWPLIFVFFAAFFVEATLGFGATLVTVGLGVLFCPLEVLLPPFVILNLVLSLIIAWIDRETIDWSLLLKRIIPFVLVGMPFGILLFHGGSHGLLYTGLGAFIVCVSVLELWHLWRRRGSDGAPASRPLAPVPQMILLAAGGVVYGAYAAGGPIAVYVGGRVITDKTVFRSTLCMLWFLLNLVLVAGYAVGGDLTTLTAELCLYLGGSLVAGLLAGQWLHGRINERVFRALVFGFLLVAGALLLIGG